MEKIFDGHSATPGCLIYGPDEEQVVFQLCARATIYLDIYYHHWTGEVEICGGVSSTGGYCTGWIIYE